VRLKLTIQHQCVTLWCWAALATSVHNFLNPRDKTKQCTLAKTYLGAACCTRQGAQTTACDDVYEIAIALRDLDNLDGAPIHPPRRTAAPTCERLDRGLPVAIDIQWRHTNPPAYHCILITGYKLDAYGQYFLHVEDSLYSPKRNSHCPTGVTAGPGAGCKPTAWMPFDEVMDRYGTVGSWYDTMYTKSATGATAPT